MVRRGHAYFEFSGASPSFGSDALGSEFVACRDGNFGEACRKESSAPCVIAFFPYDACFGFLDVLEGVVLVGGVHAVPDVYDYVVSVFFPPECAGASGGVVEETWGRH